MNLPEIPRIYEVVDLGNWRQAYSGVKVELWVNPTKGFIRRFIQEMGKPSGEREVEEFSAILAQILNVTVEEFSEWINNAFPMDDELKSLFDWLIFSFSDVKTGELISEGVWMRMRREWLEREKKASLDGSSLSSITEPATED